MEAMIWFLIGAGAMGVLWLFERGNYLAEKRRANGLQQRINYILGHTEECPTEEQPGEEYGKESTRD